MDALRNIFDCATRRQSKQRIITSMANQPLQSIKL
jgi:hypothetical protein